MRKSKCGTCGQMHNDKQRLACRKKHDKGPQSTRTSQIAPISDVAPVKLQLRSRVVEYTEISVKMVLVEDRPQQQYWLVRRMKERFQAQTNFRIFGLNVEQAEEKVKKIEKFLDYCDNDTISAQKFKQMKALKKYIRAVMAYRQNEIRRFQEADKDLAFALEVIRQQYLSVRTILVLPKEGIKDNDIAFFALSNRKSGWQQLGEFLQELHAFQQLASLETNCIYMHKFLSIFNKRYIDRLRDRTLASRERKVSMGYRKWLSQEMKRASRRNTVPQRIWKKVNSAMEEYCEEAVTLNWYFIRKLTNLYEEYRGMLIYSRSIPPFPTNLHRSQELAFKILYAYLLENAPQPFYQYVPQVKFQEIKTRQMGQMQRIGIRCQQDLLILISAFWRDENGMSQLTDHQGYQLIDEGLRVYRQLKREIILCPREYEIGRIREDTYYICYEGAGFASNCLTVIPILYDDHGWLRPRDIRLYRVVK